MTDEQGTNGAILVVGGGISGLTAALEAAEVGNDVISHRERPEFWWTCCSVKPVFSKTVSAELWTRD